MSLLDGVARARPLAWAWAIALLLVVAAAMTVWASWRGWPDPVFHHRERPPESLPAGLDLAGWASFDHDSYLPGETLRYRIRVLWRPQRATPDLEGLRNSIGLSPFHRRGVTESRAELDNAVREYILEYVLQAVDVQPSSSYQLPPATVYFRTLETGEGQLGDYRIQPPPVAIGSYYSDGVSGLPLEPLQGELSDPARWRQAVLAVSAIGLLAVAVYILAWFGRRRRATELTEAERLWRELHEFDWGTAAPRRRLLQCEQVFTRLLQLSTDLSPDSFWSGHDLADEDWRRVCEQARAALEQGYRSPEPGPETVREMRGLLEGILVSMVAERRLRRERQPDARTRLRQYPAAVLVSTALAGVSVLLLVLVARPTVWLSPELLRYNRAVKMVREEAGILQGYREFTDLAEQSADDRIRSAALYNAGTLASSPALSNHSAAQQEALFEVMFQEREVNIDPLLHALDVQTVVELIGVLGETAHAINQGATALKAALRLTPAEESIARNLEILIKRRDALAEMLSQLVEEQGGDAGLGRAQRQVIMDLQRLIERQAQEVNPEAEHTPDGF